MGFDTILFDLDGTLTDSAPGITRSAAYALRQLGIEAEPETLLGFIGPPLDESFQSFYGFDAAQAQEAIRQYRVYYTDRGWAENAVYEGIEPLLRELKAKGKALLVATSKPEVFAVKILEHFHLAHYFDGIYGAPLSDSEQSGGRKAVVIGRALADSAVRGRAVMVGDRRHDVAGAHEAGIPVIGVLYGYGSREELEAAGAEFVAADTAELLAML